MEQNDCGALRKGLTLTVFGFLFVLFGFRLTVDQVSVDLFPDFVGWFLLFLACTPLEPYTSEKPYLKWLMLGLAFYNCFDWYADLFQPGLSLGLFPLIPLILAVICAFMMFGILERIARDYKCSDRAATIRKLKIWHLALFILSNLLSIAALTMPAFLQDFYVIPMIVLLIAMAVVCIWMARTIFRLREEIVLRM